MPPWPSCDTTSYGPSLLPGASVIEGGEYSAARWRRDTSTCRLRVRAIWISLAAEASCLTSCCGGSSGFVRDQHHPVTDRMNAPDTVRTESGPQTEFRFPVYGVGTEGEGIRRARSRQLDSFVSAHDIASAPRRRASPLVSAVFQRADPGSPCVLSRDAGGTELSVWFRKLR